MAEAGEYVMSLTEQTPGAAEAEPADDEWIPAKFPLTVQNMEDPRYCILSYCRELHDFTKPIHSPYSGLPHSTLPEAKMKLRKPARPSRLKTRPSQVPTLPPDRAPQLLSTSPVCEVTPGQGG